MKLVREHINEKFTQDSDPIKDMGIGEIDLSKIYKETVINGINRWYKFLNDLDLIGKTVTFESMPLRDEKTITITEIKRGDLPNEIYFHEKAGKWRVNIRGKLIIHK